MKETTPQILQEAREKFLEKGAELEHMRWARWQSWCHKVLRKNCPSPELEKVLERWDRQIATPYSELSEQEKESDRKETRNYLPLLDSTLQAFLEAEIKRLEGKPKKREYSFDNQFFPEARGYNEAINDQITHLKEVLVTLKK